MKHYLHSPLENSLMERVNQYFKDRIESFDDYYPCMQNDCNLLHVHNWIQFFVSMYNDTTTRNNEFEIKLMEVIVSKINKALIIIYIYHLYLLQQ